MCGDCDSTMTVPRGVCIFMSVSVSLFLSHPPDCGFLSLLVTVGNVTVAVTMPRAVSGVLPVGMDIF